MRVIHTHFIYKKLYFNHLFVCNLLHATVVTCRLNRGFEYTTCVIYIIFGMKKIERYICIYKEDNKIL